MKSSLMLSFVAATTAAILLQGCGGVSSSPRSGFPTQEEGEDYDCGEIYWLLEDTYTTGSGWFFGTITGMEPLLEGMRADTDRTGEYASDDTFDCPSYGDAALRIHFKDVDASWENAPKELSVDFPVETFGQLDTAPAIDPDTHQLVWSTDGIKRATFPGAGTRMGLEVVRLSDDSYTGWFSDLFESNSKKKLTFHYRSSCVSVHEDKFQTEDDVLTAARKLEGAETLVKRPREDYAWSLTSVCWDL